MTSPLFPFYISDDTASRLAHKDAEFVRALEHENQYTNITELRISGCVKADKSLTLNGWSSASNGFIHSAGTFWNKRFELTDAEFERYVQCELNVRAVDEVVAEEEARFMERVVARAAQLRKKLLES